jgi:hypothetical protein
MARAADGENLGQQREGFVRVLFAMRERANKEEKKWA